MSRARSKRPAIDVAAEFAKLADEFHPAANLMPLPTADEFAQAEDSIAQRGQRVTALRLDGLIVDGRTRRVICERKGRKFHAKDVELGPDQTPLDLVIDLNVNRRHLTPAQRTKLIRAKLKESPDLSDALIAKKVGASDKTVGKARKKMESTSEIPRLPARKGRDGKVRDASQKRSPDPIDALGKVIPDTRIADCLDCEGATQIDEIRCKTCGGTGNFTLQDLFADNGIPDLIAAVDTILRRAEALTPVIEQAVRAREQSHAPYIKPATIINSMARAVHDLKTVKSKLQDTRPYALTEAKPGWAPFQSTNP